MNHLTIELFNHLTQFDHFTKEVRKIYLFIQNKPNFRKSQINVNKVLSKDYENGTLGERPKTNPNKPNQTQFKANSQNAKNERKLFFKKKLRRILARMAPQKQTQFKAKTNPISPIFLGF